MRVSVKDLRELMQDMDDDAVLEISTIHSKPMPINEIWDAGDALRVTVEEETV